jgi:hypothetical protein
MLKFSKTVFLLSCQIRALRGSSTLPITKIGFRTNIEEKDPLERTSYFCTYSAYTMFSFIKGTVAPDQISLKVVWLGRP